MTPEEQRAPQDSAADAVNLNKSIHFQVELPMAQNTGTQARQAPATASSAAAPAVLRQGRAADPAPTVADNAVAVAGQGTQNNTQPSIGSNESAKQTSDAMAADAADAAGSRDDSAGSNRDKAANHQRQLRLMMRQCDRVLLADYDLLAMEKWPDNARISAARRRRDLWLLAVAVAAVFFVGGVLGLLPAWLGGAGFGVFVTTLLLALPPVRRVISSRPSNRELVQQRRQMLRDARRHVAHLEGADGLVWQCERMAAFNPALASHSFSRLREASKKHTLVQQLTERKYVRLYLFYLVEADKAYQRLQQVFLDSRQEGLDQGLVEGSPVDDREDNANLTN
ncbi:hypothetical protein [Marinobacter sp. ELB17]|uniref:hypothetical protein n=1 Tax=Marinobacter sp. ELB17 TaxID=270374 RepID=UPI0000F38D7D|nr:hypothetical protein [Marinobacter sp. ELB17]EBA00942.1 hypothetical protein MELB17_17854 [Marinobacter sp. ELB17]